jgi:multidrug efflux pump subunit AcrA (membrane-fusion protein)
MADLATIPPPRRSELLLRPLGDKGDHVVKDPVTGQFFNLGPQEAFLLQRLDGQQSAEAICQAFTDKFGEALTIDDLDQFIEMARGQGFLQRTCQPVAGPQREKAPSVNGSTAHGAAACCPATAPRSAPPPPRPRQSILYWRKRVFDPDQLFNWLEPKIRFFWTTGFLVLSAIVILAAALVAIINSGELLAYLPHAFTWRTLLLAWVTVVVATTCHEFAHGLTCKHYGGEVHEVGFLMMFFMPCFYCNVSDAWLIREKWKRLLVTFAGGYCDLCLWALAVFVWRLAATDTLVSYVAWVVLSVCGGRIFFNFNPLMRLDGYYLLSDWAEVPNMRPRSWEYVSSHLRRILWGGPRPDPDPRGRFLLGYGVLSWLFSMTYLSAMLVGMVHYLGVQWGLIGLAVAGLFGFATVPAMFRGLGKGEVTNMLLRRHKRTVIWGVLLTVVPAALTFVEVSDRASGPFQVRPAIRAEIRAPVAGFLRAVSYDEGDAVSQGAPVARLEVPDLASRIAQKRAEVQETQAKVYLLEGGPRQEEVAEARHKLERAKHWRDLAEQDLDHARQALRKDLERFDDLISQERSETNFARLAYERSARLYERGTMPKEELQDKKKNYEVHEALLKQTLAQKQVREEQGTREADTELARRQKDLGDAQAALNILLAGTRPQEIDAERAHLLRLQEEAHYLEGLQEKVLIVSPVAGLVTTPHVKDRIGQYLREGDLICTIEDPAALEAEIALSEQEVGRVQPGQGVDLKARALPFATLHATVSRVAPGASARPETDRLVTRTDAQATVIVYCQLESPPPELRPGLTGYAHVDCGRRTVGSIGLERGMRLLRTEFWW